MAPSVAGQEFTNLIDSIIRNSPVSVSVADPSLPGCPLIAISDNFEALSGFKRYEVLGRNCRFLNQDCDIAEHTKEAMNKVVSDTSGKATFGGKIHNRRKDGSAFVNILRLQSIFLGGRRLIVGIQLDEAMAAVSEQDVAELETAVQRRGVLAKWMWSKAPKRPQLVPDPAEEERPAENVVQRISVVSHPKLITPDHHIENSLVILVAYRLGASVITAMGEGAASARVCQSLAEAKATAASFRRESRALCGELNFGRAEGFDFGLNPRSFVGRVGHQPTVVISGVNVPRAIAWAQRAKILVLGSFLNLQGLIDLIVQQQPTPVVLLCAGQDRAERPCVEHEVFCAFLLHTLLRTVQQPALLLLSDAARQVMQRIDPENPVASAREELLKAPRTKELLARSVAGLSDVDFCLNLNRYSRVLPWYCPFLRLFVRRRARNLLSLVSGSSVSSEGASEATGPIAGRVPDIVTPPEGRSTLRVFLVRHGEYDGELVQGMAGHLDPQLSERGLRAARRVSELLASEPLEIMLFSPLVRTMQTAEIIARPHKHRGVISEINSSLVAVDRGDWSGLTPQQVEEHFPGDLKAWADDPHFTDHGGESFTELMERTRETLEHVMTLARGRLQKGGGPIAACIVGHSSTVASWVSLAQAVQVEPSTGRTWTEISKRIGYCSVTLLEFDGVVEGPTQGRVVYIGKLPDAVETTGRLGKTVPGAGSGFVPGLVAPGSLGPAKAMAARRSSVPTLQGGATETLLRAELPSRWQVSVVTLPGEVSPEHEIEDRLVVLIDALRMSSTLVTAMGQGLESAQLFSSVMEVTHAVRDYGPCALLGGEQKRVLIPGFDRDNSPRSYLDGVTEKTALFLTTNGTRALPWVRRSKMLVLGSLLNASAVVRCIVAHLRDVSGVVLLCSGTERGTVRSEDDELCAGYLLKTLLASYKDPPSLALDDVAVSVLQKMYSLDSWDAVCQAFRATPGAAALRKIQLEGDVEFCLQRDRYRDMLPFYNQGLDIFFAHHVHYDLPVRYDPVHRSSPSGLRSGRRVLQVFLVWQRDNSDLFQMPLVQTGTAAPDLEAASAEPLPKPSDEELVGSFVWAAVQLVASSPAHPCRVTAERITRAKCGKPAEVYSGLAPTRAGDWSGLSSRDLREHFPGGLARWHQEPDWKEHGGESLREVRSRATSTFYEILRSFVERGHDGALVVVTHGELVRAIVEEVQTRPKVEERVEPIAAVRPGSVTLVELYVPEALEAPPPIPESCRFRVVSNGRSSVPLVLSGRPSRL